MHPADSKLPWDLRRALGVASKGPIPSHLPESSHTSLPSLWCRNTVWLPLLWDLVSRWTEGTREQMCPAQTSVPSKRDIHLTLEQTQTTGCGPPGGLSAQTREVPTSTLVP